jgi:hypothetical protein
MMPKVLLIVGILILMSSPAVFAAVVDLPRTGQTGCYNTAGDVVDCYTAGTGQDGALQKGVPWPSPRFEITGTGSACVLDHLTGLMWVRNPGTSGFTWQGALDHANSLDICGYTDWRVPNINEMLSLAHHGQASPNGWLIGQGFTSMYNGNYWTSTSYAASPASAWHVHFPSSVSGFNTKSVSFYAVPVRGPDAPGPAPVWKTGQTTCWDSSGNPVSPCSGLGHDGDIQAGIAWPAPRFEVGNGIEADCVTDNLTGLMWTKTPDNEDMNWAGSFDHANAIDTCGYTDWRVPNIVEIGSLNNYGAAQVSTWLNTVGFNGVESLFYWSSTTCVPSPAGARFDRFADGLISYHTDKAWSDSFRAWAVRNVFNPDISLSPGAIDFGGSVIDQTSAIQTITITNNGTADLVINTIEITGTSPTMFSAVEGTINGCAIPNAIVKPGGSCTLDMTFTPTAFDLQEALLYINSNDPDTPRDQVSLSGNGVQFLSTPLEGTIGTTITINGSGIGDKKGKVFIGTVATKVTSWTDTRITCLVKKVPLLVAPYSVSVMTKTKQVITLPDDFNVKNPELDPLTDENRGGIPEEEIVLTGKFFGSKKGKVYLEYKDSKDQTKKKSCKVTSWYMNPTTGASELKFFVPKLSNSFHLGGHPLTIDNKIGVAIASEEFVVGLP